MATDHAFAEASPASPYTLSPLADEWTLYGRGQIRRASASVIVGDCFLMSRAIHGDGEIRFRLRAPAEAPEVQLWAGFRARDRHHRYAVALRGGNNNHVYLARYGCDGAARFLGIAPLDFAPAVGVWYSLRVALQGRRIRVYANGANVPSIDVEDDEGGWTEGAVVLGGGYLPAEFGDVAVDAGNFGAAMPEREDPRDPAQIVPSLSAPRNSGRRHALYRPAEIGAFGPTRTEVSLDGVWLFLPLAEGAAASAQPAKPGLDDSGWHTIDVPHLWTPMLAWLHGETSFNELQGVSRSKGVNDQVWLAEMARLNGYGFDWETTTAAWYRHHLNLPGDIAGRQIELSFDAVAKACEIWFNGALVTTHVGMFGEIRCDISALAKPGRNVLAVKVLRNPAKLTPKDDSIVEIAESVEVTKSMISSLPTDIICHDPAGIWQPVKLIVTRPVFIKDVFIQPELDTARVDVELGAGERDLGHGITVGYEVRSCETMEVLVADRNAASGLAGDLLSLRIDLPKVTPLLWHPDSPHLYELELEVYRDGGLLDQHVTRFGFRTFRISGNRFLLNGKPYWLRGAGHFPHGLGPNDRQLAARFVSLAREGNVRATRFHVAPLTKVWAEETDRQGMLVSFEGIWPWLMLKGEPPDPALLEVWHDDFAALVRKYRNHPSVVLWTVNNEMKFYLFDRDNHELLRRKWAVVTRMIRTVRALDPTRPIVADSGYVRGQHPGNYESVVRPGGFDDGDVDDVHQYYGWYHPSFTTACAGEFAKAFASQDRPFICQELSSGYPRNDDGSPTRFYLFKHGTPQALVGDYAFEHQNPRYFLERLAFVARNTGEAIRRTNRAEVAGFMHFAYLTWFRNVHDYKTLEPWAAPYLAIRSALQPILITADFFGRHFFQGEAVALTLHLVNDAVDGRDLPAGILQWSVIAPSGDVVSRGELNSPPVPYYGNQTVAAVIQMPSDASLPGRCDVRLRLRLVLDGAVAAETSHELVLGTRAWTREALRPQDKRPGNALWLYDPTGTFAEVFAGVATASLPSLAELQVQRCPCVVIGGTVAEPQHLAVVRDYVQAGGKLLLLNTGTLLPELFPDLVTSWRPVDGQIVNLKVPESRGFDGIEPLDLAWFHCGPQERSTACEGVFQANSRSKAVTVLAEFCDFHNYLQKPKEVVNYSGSPLLECRVGEGKIIACEFKRQALVHDPIASRVLFNCLAMLGL